MREQLNSSTATAPSPSPQAVAPAYFDAPVSYHLRAEDAARAKVVVVAHIDPSGDRG
ncbi:MAG: hypothetical protein WCC28_09000 [Mycobacterium sp.]|uniref:hypothetical protein n=1 Tax=Mycobacterium sp. TaxID=1785 RepID=UPI003C730FF7